MSRGEKNIGRAGSGAGGAGVGEAAVAAQLYELLNLLGHVGRRLDRIEGTLVPLANVVTRRRTLSEQAREQGVSRTTVWRRARKEKFRMMAEGVFKNYR